MNYTVLPVLLSALFLISLPIGAQTPTDAIMMQKRELCVALMYDRGAFDEYWEGTRLRENATIATVKRNAGTAMIAAGIFNKLNLLAGLPYVGTVSSDPNGGKFAGANGLQDLALALKYEILKKPLGKGKIAVLSVLGFSTPVSNYLSDYRPYSIGFGATELSLRGIVQYELDNGLYARGAAAFLRRGQTETERDYYYNNGSYYTAWMDVPSAWNYHAVLGAWLLSYKLRLEAGYAGLKSVSGDDIRPYAAPQPTNKVMEDQLSLFGQYYFQKPKGLGVLAYYGQVVNGRNTGQSANFGVGVTYQFML